VKWQVIPSTTLGAILAGRLYGFDKIRCGDWLSPVYVTGITDEDAEIGNELLKDEGFRLEKAGA